MTRPLAPHRFVPKPGHRWRWCDIPGCDRTQSDPIHRAATTPPDEKKKDEAA